MRRAITFLIFSVTSCLCATVEYTFDVRDWVVDFLRPTTRLNSTLDLASRQTPFKVPAENRKGAILINGVYPGTAIEADLAS